MTVRLHNLVLPLAQKATAMRIIDTTDHDQDRSSAVTSLIGANLRQGDIDSKNLQSGLGIRISKTETRTTTTRITRFAPALSAEMRNELLNRAGIEILPHRSLECNPCVNANRDDFLRLTKGEIERVNDLEVEISHPMFRAKRFGAMGIHGVIVWAKDGRKRGNIEEEESNCAGLFGCGL